MDHLSNILLISALLFIISILYSSVGHGGASGYLAILSLFAFSPDEMAMTALILNIFVAGIAFYFYKKAGYFSIKLTLPFIITSVPSAYVGGFIHISNNTYFILLAIVLLLAAIRMVIPLNVNKPLIKQTPKYFVMLISGSVIGFLSGMIGIGGGILLSPLIIFMRWANAKETSATSSFFILVNSLAGLAGRYTQHDIRMETLVPFLLVALVGGSIGSYNGSYKFSNLLLTRILSVVLLIAAVKSIMKCF